MGQALVVATKCPTANVADACHHMRPSESRLATGYCVHYASDDPSLLETPPRSELVAELQAAGFPLCT